MSRSMSGGSLRSFEMKRSKSMSMVSGWTEVISNAKQTSEFAAEPRPWHRMPRALHSLTISHIARK